MLETKELTKIMDKFYDMGYTHAIKQFEIIVKYSKDVEQVKELLNEEIIRFEKEHEYDITI